MTDLNILNPLKLQDPEEVGDDKEWDEEEEEEEEDEEGEKEGKAPDDEVDYLE